MRDRNFITIVIDTSKGDPDAVTKLKHEAIESMKDSGSFMGAGEVTGFGYGDAMSEAEELQGKLNGI